MMVLAFELIIALLTESRRIVAVSGLIGARSAHLVAQKRNDRSDHCGAHEQRRREHR
jgi:hypothetical protein